MAYNTTTDSSVVIYLGDPIEHASEERFLNVLGRDLSARGVRATIVANFVTPRPNQRQIDFLVVTDARLTHIELKTLDGRDPLTGKANGPWLQHRPSGVPHRIDPNPYRQAHDGTYAISDVARALAATGATGDSDGQFYRHVDTVVCVYPDIPAGSKLEPYTHVTAVGYAVLLDRLLQPGPRPPWEASDWDAFLRRLGVYAESDATPTAIRRQRADETVAAFAHSFAVNSSHGLPALVAAGLGAETDATTLLARLMRGETVTLTGTSGAGKTHTARHLATESSRRGAVVLWLRAGEMQAGRFAQLVARAAAPHSTATFPAVADAARTVGRPLLVVADGLNECSAALRAEFLDEVRGLIRRHPAGLLVTTTDGDQFPHSQADHTVRLGAPTATERLGLLRAYRAPRPASISVAFTSPLELSIAARCQSLLPADATVTDLYDAYIRTVCPAETTRYGLRLIATALDEQLRSSLRHRDTRQILARASTSPESTDAVLASPLLRVEQGRVAFDHELFGRYLAAEALVLEPMTASGLAAALDRPEHLDLRQHTLSLLDGDGRQADVLRYLGDVELYDDALHGLLGPSACQLVDFAVSGALGSARFLTTRATVHFSPEASGWGSWACNPCPSAGEITLLRAAGLAVRRGRYTAEVAEVLDATDRHFVSTIAELAAAGFGNPVTSALAGAYIGISPDTSQLPASVIISAVPRGHLPQDGSAADVPALLADAGPRSWSRLLLAAATADPALPSHRAVMPDLLARAWAAGGYHLRLEAVTMAERSGRVVDPHTRAALVATLNTLRTENMWLDSTIVEALAACGAVTPQATAADINLTIDTILEDISDPDRQSLAVGIVGAIGEPEEIVGPIYETLEQLEPDRRVLLMLAAARRPRWFWRSMALRELLAASSTADLVLRHELLALFRSDAGPLPVDSAQPQDDINAHVIAVRGLARLSAPPYTAERKAATAWEALDQLIAALDDPAAATDRAWEWMFTNPGAAAGAVWELSWGSAFGDRELRTYPQLMERHPERLRELASRALGQRDDLPDVHRFRGRTDLERFLIAVLGKVGGQSDIALVDSLRLDDQLAGAAVSALRGIRSRT